jgi:ABC-2 type transport system ATP-binding protein
MLRLDASEECIRASLEELPSIRGLEFRGSQEEGTVDVVAEAEENADIRRDISLCLGKAGIPVLLMRPLDMSLEEIFLQVTTEEADRQKAEESAQEDNAEESAKDIVENNAEEAEK